MAGLKRVAAGMVMAMAIIISGCGSDSNPTSGGGGGGGVKTDPSFASDIQAIFNNRGCSNVGCHAASTASAGLILASGQSYANLVNVNSTNEPPKKRVVPSDAANSYLVNKIEGTQTVGGRMPLNAAPLSDTDIQNIKNWINQGAKNN